MPKSQKHQEMRKQIVEILAADFIVNEKVTVGGRLAVEELADKIMQIVANK